MAAPRRPTVRSIMHSYDVPCDMRTAVRWAAGRTAVVEVSGDLDVEAAPELRAVLDDVCRDRPALIAVDLEHVTSFSTAAVAELLATRRECTCEVRIIGAAPRVRRVMGILGLTLGLQAIGH